MIKKVEVFHSELMVTEIEAVGSYEDHRENLLSG